MGHILQSLSLYIIVFIKSIKKPVRAQNYRHLHFTLTMILMIIYDIYKKKRIKTSIDVTVSKVTHEI